MKRKITWIFIVYMYIRSKNNIDIQIKQKITEIFTKQNQNNIEVQTCKRMIT